MLLLFHDRFLNYNGLTNLLSTTFDLILHFAAAPPDMDFGEFDLSVSCQLRLFSSLNPNVCCTLEIIILWVR